MSPGITSMPALGPGLTRDWFSLRRASMRGMRTRLTLVLALAAGLFIGERATAEVAVGDRVANLTFKDIHFLPRSLDDFSKKKAFVLVFTTTSCPLVQHYL